MIESDEDDHGRALERTGFWGAQGAGCLIAARSTRRLLIPFRSEDVEQPHTWGTWGGAIDRGLTPESAVRREVAQEAGISLHVDLIPLFVFQSGSFRYHNFLAMVEDEFTPRLNWETEASRWVQFGRWPSPLHFGLKALLGDAASVAKIKAALSGR